MDRNDVTARLLVRRERRLQLKILIAAALVIIAGTVVVVIAAPFRGARALRHALSRSPNRKTH